MSQAAHRVVSAWGAALCAVLLLAGCGGPKAEKPPYAGVKLGKPYQISGRMYVPHYDPNYDKIGTASWYGPGFHGRSTASGEIYDQEGMTAAHATLPLPSIVRVTNLDNGESALIRVNDRGPFSHERIIDLSHGAAVKLGLVAHGTAHVRVQFLDKETRDYVQGASGGTQTADAVFGPPLSDAPPSAALVESAAPVPVIPASPAIVDAPLPPLAPQDNPATSSLLPKEFATAPAPLPRETLPPPREPLPVAQEEVSPAAPFTAPAPLRVGVSPFGPPQPPLAPQERAGAVPETAASPFFRAVAATRG